MTELDDVLWDDKELDHSLMNVMNYLPFKQQISRESERRHK